MPVTDRRVLTGEDYADPGRLRDRQAIYAWQQPRHDLPALVLAELAGVRGLVLDVGCGDGRYLDRLRADRPDLVPVGLDLSPGMRPDVVADATHLPVATGSVDAVLALHMLYHLPRPADGIAELARALRPGGTAVVVTNGRADKNELTALWTAALADLGHAGPPVPNGAAGFEFEDAVPLLAAAFADVRQVHLRSIVGVPDPSIVTAYLDSCRAGYEPLLLSGVSWPELLAAAARRVEATVAAAGEFVLTGHTGLFVCRAPHPPVRPAAADVSGGGTPPVPGNGGRPRSCWA